MQLADLLHRQIVVISVDRSDPKNGGYLFRFVCDGVDSVDLVVEGTPQQISDYYKEARAYWNNFVQLKL